MAVLSAAGVACLPVSQTIDVQELRVFLTLAEELAIGKPGAAAAHGLAGQPAAARAGGKLERSSVHLARAAVFGSAVRGAAVARCPSRLQELDGVSSAPQPRQRLDGTLRLGIVSGPAAGARSSIIRAFERRHPEWTWKSCSCRGTIRFSGSRDDDVELIAS